MTKKKNKGFTLLEILLVIVAIGILAAIVLVAINPNRQIAQARNTVRQADINTIQKAVEQYLIENGSYPSSISTTPGYICNTGTEQVNGSTNCSGRVDLRELVPTYLAGIPKDPQDTGTNTGYMVAINPDNNKVSISAVQAEGKAIGSNTFIVKDGLVLNLDAGNPASYPFSGPTWTDLVSNVSGSLNNGPTYNSLNGGSISFDDVDDFVRFTRTDVNGGTFAYTNITCNLWINPGSSQNSGLGWTNNLITVEDTFEISIGNRGNGFSSLYYASVPWVWYGTNSDVVKNDSWNMITFVHATTGRWLYVNGTQVFYRGDTGNLIAGSAAYPYLTIGGRYVGTGSPYGGRISNIQLYNRALTPEEIQKNFNATRGRFGL
jgi:prepilin-type N-terminal cleavage/methylation domain-containing protein